METDEFASEIGRVKQWVACDFPGHEAEFIPLLLAPDSGRPLYLTHLPIVLQTLRVPHLPDWQRDSLDAAYVYITSSFYCVDALADGHPQLEKTSSASDVATALPLLVSAAIMRLQTAVPPQSGSDSTVILRMMRDSFFELRAATQSENEYCAGPETPFFDADETFHLAGRSASIIFLFRAIGHIINVEVSERLLTCIRSILVAIQLGDDVSDWVSDFTAQKWTPFLRRCWAGGARDFAQLERLIVQDSMLERALGDVARRLNMALVTFPTDPYDIQPLSRFVSLQVAKVRSEIERVVTQKIEGGARYEWAAD